MSLFDNSVSEVVTPEVGYDACNTEGLIFKILAGFGFLKPMDLLGGVSEDHEDGREDMGSQLPLIKESI